MFRKAFAMLAATVLTASAAPPSAPQPPNSLLSRVLQREIECAPRPAFPRSFGTIISQPERRSGRSMKPLPGFSFTPIVMPDAGSAKISGTAATAPTARRRWSALGF